MSVNHSGETIIDVRRQLHASSISRDALRRDLEAFHVNMPAPVKDDTESRIEKELQNKLLDIYPPYRDAVFARDRAMAKYKEAKESCKNAGSFMKFFAESRLQSSYRKADKARQLVDKLWKKANRTRKLRSILKQERRSIENATQLRRQNKSQKTVSARHKIEEMYGIHSTTWCQLMALERCGAKQIRIPRGVDWREQIAKKYEESKGERAYPNPNDPPHHLVERIETTLLQLEVLRKQNNSEHGAAIKPSDVSNSTYDMDEIIKAAVRDRDALVKVVMDNPTASRLMDKKMPGVLPSLIDEARLRKPVATSLSQPRHGSASAIVDMSHAGMFGFSAA